MPKSISFLLGAGFSAPMGYPIGNKLNDNITGSTANDLWLSSDGRLIAGKKPATYFKTTDDWELEFCLDLIQHYRKEREGFDYEEFYDFFTSNAPTDPGVAAMYKKKNYGTARGVQQMLFAIRKIYAQLVAHYLVDRNGNSWYDDAPHMGGPSFPGYTGILNCLRSLSDTCNVNVHTLNHDLFFERFQNTDWLFRRICDGFQELGSPYYGELNVNHRTYKCRLEYYTGIYDRPIRLFKLHGSKDYGLYYRPDGPVAMIPETYVKSRHGIGFSNFCKEVDNEHGALSYEKCWINYHADFLTGTTSKIERYKEPLLFKRLFEHFRTNLNEAELLVIIGYGAKDSEVNKILLENFDYANKQVFIIDPYAGSAVKDLQNQLNATLITKQLEDITLEDFKAGKS